ncbi:MAG TPA: hypothetical protein VK194_11080, partial [Candidatus Deferrimicrobium sp.]|nr:hypothetical protein [Candidatus Deferrimicrobium sp.]
MRSTRRATTGRSERPPSTTRSAAAVARLAGAGLVGPGIGVLRGGPSTSAPDGGLAGGTGGLVIPIALAVVAGLLVGGLLLVTIARRRTRAAASEAAASDETLSGAPGLGSGRDPNLPRWLDPSVTAARFRPDTTTAVRAVALATAPPRLPVVFGTPADELAERRRVRYDGVPLLDRPDDVLGRTIGEVDGGDEVELLERGEIWAQ